MNIVVAIDSLKGSLTSLEAGYAVSDGIRKVFPDADVLVRPLADGGEGTVEALTLGMNGTLRKQTVTGPLGKPVEAVYGILDSESGDTPESLSSTIGAQGKQLSPLPASTDTAKTQSSTIEPQGKQLSPLPASAATAKTAVIEMAAAAGITLLNEAERNPLLTTTYGVGELILDAVKTGCRHFIIGIGGSATNDGGVGMLQALGFGFLDKNGQQIPHGAQGLETLSRITDDAVIPELKECSFRIACDVTNPLCGEQGCSAVFGPQKGATFEMIPQMDKWLHNYAALAAQKYPSADAAHPGCGAAGGLGFAFLTFMNAVLESGIQIVLEETRLENAIQNADLVITGEGRLDAQTVMGKAPIGVARIAKKYNKKVIAFSGCVTEDSGVCNEAGIDAFFPILRQVVSLPDAMRPDAARQNMTDTVEQVFRLIRALQLP